MKLTSHISFVALFLFGAVSYASDQALTWQQCVEAVRQKNPDLAASTANVRYQNAQYSGSYSNFFPQLSASVGATNGNPLSVPGEHQYNETLSLNQSLFNGFGDIGKVRQSRANLEAAKAQLALLRATVSANLKSAFAQLLFQQKNEEVTAAILSRQQENLRMIDLRFKGGNENKGNLLYQQAVVAQARYQHNRAVRQKRNAVQQLAALWGEPQLKELRVEGELGGHTPGPRPDFEALAISHPNHVNYVQQSLAADAGVQIANANWMPDLNIIGSIGTVGASWPPMHERWSIGLSLTFPFFPGTSTLYAVEAAHAQRTQARLNETSTDNKIIANLEDAFEGLMDAVEQQSVAEEFEKAAKARSLIANGKYNTGLMTFENWALIDSDFVTRQLNLLQSQLAAMQAEANWESAKGTGELQ